MVRPSRLAALGLVFCVATTSRAAEAFDLIPADALGGVACRSIGDLVQKSEKLARDGGLDLPQPPGEVCKQAFALLGIQAGLDTKAGCAAVVVNKKHVGAEFN